MPRRRTKLPGCEPGASRRVSPWSSSATIPPRGPMSAARTRPAASLACIRANSNSPPPPRRKSCSASSPVSTPIRQSTASSCSPRPRGTSTRRLWSGRSTRARTSTDSIRSMLPPWPWKILPPSSPAHRSAASNCSAPTTSRRAEPAPWWSGAASSWANPWPCCCWPRARTLRSP